MASFFIGLGTVLLMLLGAIVVLVILMQRASSNAGMGAALGGGAAESALGGAAGNVLTKISVWGMGAFFVLAFVLYLGQLGANAQEIKQEQRDLRELNEQLEREVAEREAAAKEAGDTSEAAAPMPQPASLTDLPVEILPNAPTDQAPQTGAGDGSMLMLPESEDEDEAASEAATETPVTDEIEADAAATETEEAPATE